MSSAVQTLPSSIAQLRAIAIPATDHRILHFGLSDLDSRLGGGGLRAGALHEVSALSVSMVDDAAATLFPGRHRCARSAGNAAGRCCGRAAATISMRRASSRQDLSSADVIHAQPRDDAALLAVVEDAVRDGTPSAVVAEVEQGLDGGDPAASAGRGRRGHARPSPATLARARTGSARRAVRGLDALADRQRALGAAWCRRRRAGRAGRSSLRGSGAATPFP